MADPFSAPHERSRNTIHANCHQRHGEDADGCRKAVPIAIPESCNDVLQRPIDADGRHKDHDEQRVREGHPAVLGADEQQQRPERHHQRDEVLLALDDEGVGERPAQRLAQLEWGLARVVHDAVHEGRLAQREPQEREEEREAGGGEY